MAFLDLQKLEKGLLALKLPLNQEQVQCLDLFAEYLYRWNRVYNLTAIQNKDEVLTHHILDSLSLAVMLKKLKGEKALDILDVGAGGGLPAIPLAICLPDSKIHMIDAVAKKVAFLRQSILMLKLPNAQAFHGRVESNLSGQYDVVTSRAFSSLPNFFNLTQSLMKPSGFWLAMKGILPTEELKELDDLAIKYEIYPVKVPFLEQERHLIRFYK